MKKMLEKNPKHRISAQEALRHSYFLAPSLSMECIDEVKDNIQIYNKFYKKNFNSFENQWLISPGMEKPNQTIHDSVIFFNKIALNGKIQTIEKISQNSNFSIKLDSPIKIPKFFSGFKGQSPKSGEMNKILINTCSTNSKGVANFSDALNYINLFGETKKQSDEIFRISSEQNFDSSEFDQNLNENRTINKLEDIGEKNNFKELIKQNMK